MITEIAMQNFKSFAGRGHTIPLGPLTLMVGTNASGKSNLRDALRFLHGVARGYSLAEIFGEKYGEGGVLQWKGIRGGVREAVHGVSGGSFVLSVRARRITSGHTRSGERTIKSWSFLYRIELEINLKRKAALVVEEQLLSSGKPVFSSSPAVLRAAQLTDGKQLFVRYRKPGSRKFIGPTQKLRRDQPMVSQLAEHPDASLTARNACRAFLAGMESMRFLDLDPQSLRRPSLPGQMVLGDKGENLSSVLQSLCEDKAREESLIEWTRELTPLDVVGLEFPQVSLEGRIQLLLVENGGRKISAESASDGTLRFLAFAAALLGTKPAETYVFEEIENGIHPNRVHLLLELLQRSTEGGKVQVIATTHSPALLNFLRGKALANAVLVSRNGNASRLRRLADLPMSEADKSVAGDLLESGWFENVSAFLNAEEAERKEELS